jgi:hypothetical protein
MTARQRGFSVALLLLAGACRGADDTALVVEVSTDLAPVQLDAIRVRAWTRDDAPPSEWTFDLDRVGRSAELPGRLGLVPQDPAQMSPVRIEAAALKTGQAILTREAALSFQPGRVVLLRLDLRAECMCHPCPSGQTCEEGAVCRPVAKDVSTLLPYGPRADASARASRPAESCNPANEKASDAHPAAHDGAAAHEVDAHVGVAVEVDAGEGRVDAGAGPDAGFAGDSSLAAAADTGFVDPPPSADAALAGPDSADARPDAVAPVDARDPPPAWDAFIDPEPDVRPTLPDAAVADAAVADAAIRDAAIPDAAGPEAPAGRSTGESCAIDADCALKLCVDHVCCQAACTDRCMACARSKTGAADGTCAPVAADSDPDGDCAADQPASCLYDGTCDGRGACRFYSADTRCGPPVCNGSSYTGPQLCSGGGVCAAPVTRDCGRYRCTLEGCLTSCDDDASCADTAYCQGNTCAAKKGVGAACGGARECSSGLCPVGLCL